MILAVSVLANAALVVWLTQVRVTSSPHGTEALAGIKSPSTPTQVVVGAASVSCRAELTAARAELHALGTALRKADEEDLKRVYDGGENKPARANAVAAVLGDLVDAKAAFECHDVVCHYELAAPTDGVDPVDQMARHPWQDALFEKQLYGPDGVWARLRDNAPADLDSKLALDDWLSLLTSMPSLGHDCGEIPANATLNGSVDSSGNMSATAAGVDTKLGECVAQFVALRTPAPLRGLRVAAATSSVPLMPRLPGSVSP